MERKGVGHNPEFVPENYVLLDPYSISIKTKKITFEYVRWGGEMWCDVIWCDLMWREVMLHYVMLSYIRLGYNILGYFNLS